MKRQLKIEAIRIQLGLTRIEMAKELGISLDRYNRLAVDRTRLRAGELIKLQKISGLSGDEIAFK